MNESYIIELIRKRDDRGMEELLLHYGPLIRYVVAPIVKDSHDQEDCVSEVAMRIWEKIELFDDMRGSWTGWITSVARNTALNKVRSQRSQNLNTAGLSNLDEAQNLPASDPGPEEQILRIEQKAALTKAIDNLPHGDRILFYRKYYYLQSTAQIASELGMTERAVEGRLYRLKQKLRKTLEGGVFHD